MHQEIKNLPASELESWLTLQGVAPYRAGQILKWIYQHQCDDFDAMSNLAKPLRSLLSEHFINQRTQIAEQVFSHDGTCKYVLELLDGNRIECVLIPEKDHQTLCISSQVGCPLGCRFCITGQGGLVRNLSTAEILSQVRDIQNSMPAPHTLTNLVFMGMGEPLLNLAAVLPALPILVNENWGMGFSTRRITLSSAGIIPALAELGQTSGINLAISLNAPNDSIRSQLMPINRRYPLEALLEACHAFPLPPRRRITFEYILIAGINDSPANARELVKILRPLRAKVNLIPLNEGPGIAYQRPSVTAIETFQKILQKHHLTVMIRQSKGSDIGAACGQLWARGQQADI